MLTIANWSGEGGFVSNTLSELGPYKERVWSDKWDRKTEGGIPADPGQYLIYATYWFEHIGESSRDGSFYFSLPYELELK